LRAQTGAEPSKQQIEDAVGAEVGDRWLWPADRLGKFLKLTLDEKRSAGIRTIRCYDVPAAEVAAIYRRGRQERQNRRRRDRRERERAEAGTQTAAPSLSPREAAIANLLTHEEQALPDLAERAAGLPAFVGEHGVLLSKESMQRAARRVVDQLIEAGVATDRRAPRPSGTDMRFVRLAAGGPDFPVTRPSPCPGGQLSADNRHGRTTERPLSGSPGIIDEQPLLTADNEMAALREAEPKIDGRTEEISSAAIGLSAEPLADDDLGIPDFLQRRL
jgi:hypothetical protein